jgi:hypothetical protein
MTTVHPAPRTVRSVRPVLSDVTGGNEPGPRVRRLRERRRLRREELLVGVVLLIALGAALVILGLQWLNSGPSAAAVVRVGAHIMGGPL